jgi:hypothetical protein
MAADLLGQSVAVGREWQAREIAVDTVAKSAMTADIMPRWVSRQSSLKESTKFLAR